MGCTASYPAMCAWYERLLQRESVRWKTEPKQRMSLFDMCDSSDKPSGRKIERYI
jgi:hypothetical protein